MNEESVYERVRYSLYKILPQITDVLVMAVLMMFLALCVYVIYTID